MNSKRMNRLEELGRVDAEKADTSKGKRNLRDEKSRIVRELKAKGGKAKGKHGYKKEGGKKGLSPKLEGAERLAAKKKQYRDMGFGDMMDKGEIVIGRKFGQMKNGGRALKPVPAGKKGLSKLPTKVRNKMGFMKKGGRVNDKTKPKKPLSGAMKKPKPGSQSYQFQQTQRPRPRMKSGGLALRGRGCEIK